MKIVHVVDSMRMGGAETLVAQMCRQQRKLGHEAIIYAVYHLGVLGEEMQANGFEVRAHIASSLTNSVQSFFRLFRESMPDVVHLHNPTPTIYAAAAARLAGVPTVVSTRHSLVAPPHDLFVEFKYALSSRFCDWVVGICDATTANLKHLHTISRRKIIRIYNGAVPLQRTPEIDWPRKKGFTLVYVGRLEPVKNHSLLLNAFHKALSSSPNLHLWMVGDGSERQRLEKLTTERGLSERVVFWGQQLDVAPFFTAADAVIMSSLSEGLPISLLQAFSLGLPAVVTNVGGMGEVVCFSKAGLTVSPSDVEGMANAILHLVNDDVEREGFSKAANMAFQAQFRLETMVNSYIDLYKNTPRARRNKK